MDELQKPETNPVIPNLILLKVLCVMTFIGSGMGFISYGLIGLIYDFFSHNLSLIPDEQNREMIATMLAAGKPFFFLNAILFMGSFTGAYQLWKMKRSGFHFYTISQILLLILPMIFMKGFSMPFTNILLSLIFIFGYYGFLKFMKPEQEVQ